MDLTCGCVDAKHCAKGLCRKCYKAVYYKENSEKIAAYRKENSEQIAARQSAWRRANKTRCKDYAHARRALLAGLHKEKYDFAAICEAYGYLCAYCIEPQPGVRLTRDHVVAITDPMCPGDIGSNIAPACKSCNSSKSNKSLAEWCARTGRSIETFEEFQERLLTLES